MARIGRRHFQAHRPVIRIIGSAAERPRRPIEAEPRRQRIAARQARAQRQCVPRILVGKRIGRHHKAKRRIFRRTLIRNRVRHRWYVVHIRGWE